ncbi:phosphocholine cytidylyltransferase family protein [Salinimicrobium sediminilitoris]|uniref:phosphocholine cytidylyltransferase family protein n=1 Tax=Salinimicrobium sediminilitoris TaxID=2876715 RepID=UPI001E511737|nr:phosphocholine cytidylyltransferase family protein [Salinimicrobium sediminilitoris]MCC8361450.1 phosphocholine cytidylyltransferase family protein [Salinimicrobium sediminilitoris]
MKIVILAAGIGSRLGNPFPKPLTPLKGGKSIMEKQVENFSEYFNEHDISVVVGFKKDLIMERFPDLTYIYNQFFDATNTSKSLLKALKKYRNEDVLWINGDVIFDSELFSVLNREIEARHSFVAVNTSRVAEEEVKYTLKNGKIDELSKQVKNGLGEAVGINFVTKQDMPVLLEQLENCDDNDYFERGIEKAIAENNMQVNAVDISDFRCMEVDFKEDLEVANNLF